jgi:hypothetical protein
MRVLLEGKAQQRMSSVVHAWKLPDLLRFTAMVAALLFFFSLARKRIRASGG